MTAFAHRLRRWCTRLVERAVRRLAAVVTGIAFWTGVITPLLYLVFIVPGVRTRGRLTLFLVLIAINYLALILGYPHHNSPDDR